MTNLRRALTLSEVMIAVGLLAVVGTPLIASMLSARKNIRSSLADVQAAARASQVAEMLASIPAGRLPSPVEGLTPAPERTAPGVPRARWEEDFEVPPGGVDLAELLAEKDPEGQSLYLWFEPVDATAKDGPRKVLVTVAYRGSTDPKAPVRRLSIQALALEEP